MREKQKKHEIEDTIIKILFGLVLVEALYITTLLAQIFGG
jgi:uncharacterized membrane protein